MFNKKLLLGLSIISAFKLESASDTHNTASLDEPMHLKMGLKVAHPLVIEAVAHLVSAPPVRINPRVSAGVLIELVNIRSVPSSLVYDQLQLGSCTANAMGFIIRYLSVRNSSKPTDFSSANKEMLNPSRLYHYYNTRYEEGNITGDSTNVLNDNGASMQGAMIALDKYGTCPETFSSSLDLENGFHYSGWVYNISMFTRQPTPESYRFAFDPSYNGISTTTALNPYKVIYQNIRYVDLCSKYVKSNQNTLNTTSEKNELVANFRSFLGKNNPIYLGILLESAFYNAGTNGGYVPMPATTSSKFTVIGGHALVIVGHGQYNSKLPSQNYFKFLNSWGPTWGASGFGYFPEDYVANANFFGITAYAVDLLK
jgi:C1A family cysteine protease